MAFFDKINSIAKNVGDQGSGSEENASQINAAAG